MQRVKLVFAALVILLLVPSCQSEPTVEEPRAGFGSMGLNTPPTGTPLLGPEAFPCRSGTANLGYWRYGVGRMRRGGWEVEEREANHNLVGGAANKNERTTQGARRVYEEMVLY